MRVHLSHGTLATYAQNNMADLWRIPSFLYLCLHALATSGENPNCHLQPFGCHTPPNVDVEEFTVEHAPVPEEFFKMYVRQNKPAIFRSAVTQSVASRLWSDEYISKHFGDMEVRLEAKNEKTHLPPRGEKYLGRDNLRHFVETYHNRNNNVYIVSDLPQLMYKDVGIIPSFGACGQMAKRIVEVDLWWSGGSTSSIIHKDEYNQINCLINGTKQWKLIESKYEEFLYKHPEPDYELGGFSDIDPTAIDLKKFPDVTNIEWSNFIMYAGDCLFLPKGYYHLVTSSGTHNLAVSILFSRFDRVDSLDFSDCNVDVLDMRTPRSLAELDVQWQWVGKGTMVMGRQDLEERYRAVFAQRVAEMGRKANYDDIMKIISEKFTTEEGTMRFGDVHKVFAIMDKNGDGFVTNEEIRQLAVTDLRAVASEIEPFEPSAVYWFEYSVIAFERVWNALQNCLKKYKIVSKDAWLQQYQQLGGTEDFGLEIYQRLLKGNHEIKSDEINDEDIWRALENWVKFWASQYSNLSKKPSISDSRNAWEIAGKESHDDDEDESFLNKETTLYGNEKEEL